MSDFQKGNADRVGTGVRWFVIMCVMAVFVATGGVGCYPSSLKSTSEKSEQPPAWPQDQSDLSADPDMVFGRLDNGLRYIVKENRTPSDRVSMHLYIQAGSLQEEPREQGVAHFLEHMLFNGSTNFPPGEMVKYFQRIGMQFGPDANAHTGFVQTVYDVILPRGDEQSLSEGLLVLRDYADGALLLPEEVEREKKVILAEMRSRDSARFRTLKASFAFEMPDLLVSQRFPIGLETTVRQATAETLRGFYSAWYRPERMVLILVGDLDTQSAIEQVRRRFDSLQPMGPVRQPADFGSMAHQGIKALYHHEEEAGATSVSIESILQERQPSDSAAQRRLKMLERLANRMVQKRLDRIVQGGKSVLTSASIASGRYLKEIKYAEIGAECKPEHWQAAIAEVEQALRRALAYGFSATELQQAKEAFLASLDKNAKSAETRNSKSLTRGVTRSLNNSQVILSPVQELALLAPMVEAVTLEQVNQAFNGIWSDDHRLVLVTGNARIKADASAPGEKVVAAYNSSLLASVTPPQERELLQFPYLETPTRGGDIADRGQIEDLGIEKVEYANGFTLFLKPTDFKDDEVMVALSFGDGKASEPEDQPGLSMMTETVVNESGFGRMDFLQLQEALAGKVARTRLSIREEMFVINGESGRKDLPLLFQLLYASVLDPGYRPGIRSLAMKRWEQEYMGMARTTEGAMKLKAQSFLAGGDHRFGLPPIRQLQQRTLDQIRQWYGRQLRDAPLELAVVGDFDPEVAIELASRFFGSLPKRDHLPSMAPNRLTFPDGEALRITVETNIPKAMVVVAYPTEDFWDIRRTRRLTVMAELLSERLREHIRENLGAAYSPYAYNRSHRAYKGYGTTQVHLLVDPKQAEDLATEVKKIVRQVTVTGADDDEFRRILDPTLTYIKDARQKNGYWLNSVLTGAGRYPRQLDWSRSFTSDYASITSDEILKLAVRYLNNQRAATVIITPTK